MADLDDVELLDPVQRADRIWFQCAYRGQSVWIGMTAHAVRIARSANRLSPEQLAKARLLWAIQQGSLQEHLIDSREFDDPSFDRFLCKQAGLGPPDS